MLDTVRYLRHALHIRRFGRLQSRGSAVSIVTMLQDGWTRRAGIGHFLFAIASRPALGPTLLSNVYQGLFPHG